MKKTFYLLILSIMFAVCTFASDNNGLLIDYNNTYNYVCNKPINTKIFGERHLSPITNVIVEENDNKRKNKLCLSIDCAYNDKYISEILDVLDKYNVKTTFFATLPFVKNEPEYVKRIIDSGHELGCHSVTHRHFNTLSNEEVQNEIVQCHNFVKNNYNLNMNLFRFPYGEYSQNNMTVLANLGYYPINWSFDSLDWQNRGVGPLCEKVLYNKFKSGDILLFHASGVYTKDALPSIIEYLRLSGFDFIKISDMIYKENCTSNWGKMRRIY